ncbi:DNA cytosine methyltransferase [Candidatus Liberibacter solanacearum]|uniref:DNA cytosine methyltransferase n=1 Tax=Candidatus Liberibacter solanacearum TaxID=556287 RepID=UPI0019D33980|nr:DNA (cytosine-5-)-methyltransferase [Candidatus Liberibacter solanacearum]
MTTKLTSLELFAGCGGLSLGLEESGISPMLLLDCDYDSCKTLSLNRPQWNVVHDTVENFAMSNLLKYNTVDIISAGFPCQPFSFAGKKRGFQDERGSAFFYFLKIVQKINPNVILLENVKGIVTHDKGKTLLSILAQLDKLNYEVNYKILNAWHYNIGQKRERAFFIGMKKELNMSFMFPSPCGTRLTLKDVLKDISPSPGMLYPESKRKVLDLAPLVDAIGIYPKISPRNTWVKVII